MPSYCENCSENEVYSHCDECQMLLCFNCNKVDHPEECPSVRSKITFKKPKPNPRIIKELKYDYLYNENEKSTLICNKCYCIFPLPFDSHLTIKRIETGVYVPICKKCEPSSGYNKEYKVLEEYESNFYTYDTISRFMDY